MNSFRETFFATFTHTFLTFFLLPGNEEGSQGNATGGHKRILHRLLSGDGE